MLSIKKAKKKNLATIAGMDSRLETENKNPQLQISDSTQAWLNWIENGHVLKAVDDNQNILGILVMLASKKGGYCIHKILIEKHLNNAKDVANQLINSFLNKIDKHEKTAFVIVHPDDQKSIDLYASLGFNKQTLHPNYLGENEDRLKLSRPVIWSDTDVTRNSPCLTEANKKQQRMNSNLFLKSMNFNNYRV